MSSSLDSWSYFTAWPRSRRRSRGEDGASVAQRTIENACKWFFAFSSPPLYWLFSSLHVSVLHFQAWIDSQLASSPTEASWLLRLLFTNRDDDSNWVSRALSSKYPCTMSLASYEITIWHFEPLIPGPLFSNISAPNFIFSLILLWPLNLINSM